MTKKEIKLARANGCLDKIYDREVNLAIRKKYSESEEMAMIRHHALDPVKYADEWEEYNEYVEECKRSVKTALELE